jgi:hypothetical protein
MAARTGKVADGEATTGFVEMKTGRDAALWRPVSATR